jgi:hypothetical protein
VYVTEFATHYKNCSVNQKASCYYTKENLGARYPENNTWCNFTGRAADIAAHEALICTSQAALIDQVKNARKHAVARNSSSSS